MKNRISYIVGIIAIVAIFSLVVLRSVSAQTDVGRSYVYEHISNMFLLHEDASVSVEERQTYRFAGEYHQGWRNIPEKGFDDLTVLGVMDADTGEVYTYSSTRLDKTDPTSWGKYTTFVQDGEEIIEWYFNVNSETKTFVLTYTMSGVVGFFADHDEFYWNLFTDYTVPVEVVDAVVILPTATDVSQVTTATYVSTPSISSDAHTGDGKNIFFEFHNVPPQAAVTIAPGWPKGIVSESTYQKVWFNEHWGYVGAGILIFFFPIILFLRWYMVERRGTGRGTIIPQYEPPKQLPPAMAEIIVNEHLSQKTWPATIIDLAVRGYIIVNEIPASPIAEKAVRWILISILLFAGIAIAVALARWESLFALPVFAFIFFVLQKKTMLSSDYILILKEHVDTTSLESYEQDFLTLLFLNSGRFSTKEMKQNMKASRILSIGLQALQKIVSEETAEDIKIYAVGFTAWQRVSAGIIIIGSGIVYLLLKVPLPQLVVFLAVCGYVLIVTFLFFMYNPRLNKEGQVLREDWLGFKLYLETAERYRLQNLTPETFEKFLPYAIMFGVEKKWGKAFEGMNMVSPTWYVVGVSGNTSTGISTGFSPTAFSASFATAFSSAFASSGGAASGGGGAGGGGGGGGGGAS